MRVLALVLLLAPAVAGAAPYQVIYRLPQDARPTLVAGDLSAPSRLAPEAVARGLLQRSPGLAPVDPSLLGPARVWRLQRGTVVRFALQHQGIPVADAHVAVRLDAEGRVRMIVGSPVRADANGPTPRLSADEARSLVATVHAPARAAAAAQAEARLVWQPMRDRSLRLAWELRLPQNLLLPEQLLVRVDAESGALLGVRNLVRFADQGKVYPTNPVTSTLTTVTLEGRAPNQGQPADALSNPLLNVFNCKDNHNTIPMSYMGQTFNVHLCDEVSTVLRDGNGDYLFDPPLQDVWGPDPASAPADEDAFSEVQMYYHVMKVYGYFRAFGDPAFTELDAKPIQATVNFRIPIDYSSGGLDIANLTNPNGILYPFPNAFFMPPGQLLPGLIRPASMVFGQGETSDFAYDGDVIYHEFTHAVIWSTSNLTGPGLDELGLDPAPMGLNEAFADIFSAFLSGGATVGEYAAGELGGIRDLSVKYRCPDLLWGEAHQDSMAFSWAVWAIRQDLGAGAEAPVFAALVQLPEDASFGIAAAAVEEELEQALGVTARQAAHAIFLEANLVDCKRIIDYTAPRELLVTEGTSIGIDPVPGYLQFKYTLPARAQSLRVTFDWLANAMSMMGAGAPAYSVYVRKDAPVEWSYGISGAQATKDHEFQLTSTNQYASWSGSLDTILEPGDYYLQIVSTGQAGGYLQQIAITHTGAPQEDAGAPPQEDSGTPPQQDGGPGAEGRDTGCGCAAAPQGAGLFALLGLVALAAFRRRRW